MNETPEILNETFKILIVKEPITQAELSRIAEAGFGNLVKAVVDIEQKIMALSGELHADEEAVLLENGDLQKNLWGINLYPGKSENEFIEFDSMINIRPSQNNKSRSVENPEIQRQIVSIVNRLIQ